MARKTKEYDYLLQLYSRVNKYLSDNRPKPEELEEVIVSFCVVVERVLKMKLHAKNPILIFDVSRLKDDETISALALRTDTTIETINIQSTLNRFKILFKKTFSEEEIISIKETYKVRNSLVHSYLSEEKVITDKEDLIKRMSFIWPKISKLTKSVLGKERILSSKPKKSYTELEFKKAIVDELMKKIKQPVRSSYSLGVGTTFSDGFSVANGLTTPYPSSGTECPRCSSMQFSINNEPFHASGFGIGGSANIFEPILYASSGYGFGGSTVQIYKCKNCNLELTQNEYELVKKELFKGNNSRRYPI